MDDRITSLDDYRRIRAAFRWEAPAEFNFGFDVVDRWAAADPERTAIQWVGPDAERTVSFGEISRRSNQVAQALTGLGIGRGEKVLVILPRIVPWWETMVGLLKAGIVAIPGTPLLTAGDIAFRAEAAEAVGIITEGTIATRLDEADVEIPRLKQRIMVDGDSRDGWLPYADLVESAAADRLKVSTSADDPALLYFTSGTTGMPKMVLHTQASYGVGHQVTGRYWLDLREDDLHWNVSDNGWAKAAWSSLFGPWNCGAGLFVQESGGKFNAGDVLNCLAKYPITSMCAAPTIYRVLVQRDLSKFRPAALRSCVAAGEPLNPEVIAVWQQATGITVRDGYGQTETVLLCGNFPGVPVRQGSMGLPAPGFDLAVIDESGCELPANQEGDIAVRIQPQRPLGLFREYWNNATDSAATVRGDWYVTGDRAYVDDDGYFWFVARADDVITSSAYRIGPFEVESALIEHPAVVEAAVVGKPDKMRGQIVKAFVVLAAGSDPTEVLKSELQEHVKTSTAPYKYPREIEFVDELPKTVSGKIRRVELRGE